MNRQILIKEYADYGFEPQDIARELNIPLALVKAALEEPEPKQTEVPAQALNYYKLSRNYKTKAMDRDMPMYEILYKYGPIKINKMLKKMGLIYTAELMNVDKNAIIALKYHFGYHNELPKEALNKISYFSNDLRRQIDERDGRKCIRCGKYMPEGSDRIRYHKITHPGPMCVDNGATLCRYCRAYHIIPQMESNRWIFQGMRIEEFTK